MAFTGAKGEVKLLTLDPGHFHAYLVQKSMYDQVNPVVHVYAPEGPELVAHNAKINEFNTRAEDPTHWEQKVYTGPDYLEKMMTDKAGNVVVLAGSNAKKTEYIKAAIDSGINVLADKPMIIVPEQFELLKAAFASAEEKGLLLYDIMTERYEVTTILQKELAQSTALFGQLEKGTPEEPAISKESIHHFFKYVAGSPLVRPAWFFDVNQQGEGIVDVATHLVDLVLWECFPGQGIDYTKDDVSVVKARRWATELTPEMFGKVTGLDEYPDYLNSSVKDDSVLNVFSNGEFVFQVNGVHGKVSVIWNFQAPEGAGDTHYSIMRGTAANLVIRQDEAQGYKPTLYIEDVAGRDDFETVAKEAVAALTTLYAGLELKPTEFGLEVVVPDKFKLGHEAHFSQVTEKYLQYLIAGKLPEWEIQNMLTKYYLNMQAYQMSR
ncbi:MAG: Gfo/Idh/MocA family oxidoreductase [Cyclobacteriaceae bacterium]|nr:Gfo/Idh/MocA family oxidoreductase [Cyclobacteriaceae bacterium]